jgi:hypothetical protein
VIKTSKTQRQSVRLRQTRPTSRIRRDPALADKPRNLSRNAWWASQEWEIRLAAIGITFFALAISAVVIDLGEVFGY